MLVSQLWADNVNFTASAPNSVPNGQTFQLVYSVNASSRDLRIPEITDFEIVAGPFTSSSSSMQIINGHTSSSRQEQYTFTLLPHKVGTFTIPSASITVGGNRYQSNAVTIKVLPADSQPANPGSSSQSSHSSHGGNVQTSQNITSDNLFVRAIVSRTKVYEQEAILVTYKIYSRVNLVNISQVKFPDFPGFLVQEIDVPQDKQASLENYNGHNYNTYILRQVLLYPQHAGTIRIDPLKCEAIVRVRTQHQTRSIFDDFFDSYQDVNKNLEAPSVAITAMPLPAPKPADFGGAVGRFNIKSSINTTDLKEHESLTVKITIAGTGNIKLIETPKIQFPTDFETYDPKVTNNFTNSTSGTSGTKTIEYLAIPRHKGKFNIPGISFTYFDVDTHTYKTLTTESYDVNVEKGNDNDTSNFVGGYTNQEQVKLLASDIRYIDTKPLKLKAKTSYFVGSTTFWLSLLLPLIITIVLIFIFRKLARDNADVVLMKNKKANKMARKRLKNAEKELQNGNKEKFYDEVLKAFWGYLGDKLDIPVSNLNKETAAETLEQHRVEKSVIEDFIKLLNDCEFERYAPLSDSQSAMDHIYDTSIKLISKLDSSIK